MSPFDGETYQDLAKFMEDSLYNQLTSTEKSEEYGVEFLEIRLGERRKNYAILKKVSKYFGEIMANKMKAREGQTLSEAGRKRLIKRSMDEACTKWEGENGQRN